MRLVRNFLTDRRANVAVIMALSMVPLVGMLSLAGETASWWMYQRTAQNAADSAAIAAAWNSDSTTDGNGVAYYVHEGQSAATEYGYANGVNNATVAVTSVTCPADTTSTTCYQAQITKKVPLFLTQIVGFRGDDGTGFKLISAKAIATPTGGAAPPFCLIALGSSAKKDLTINGGPKSDLPGCAVGSNGATTCNDANGIPGTTASYAANGDNNDCASNGNDQTLSSPITDPYASIASNNDVPKNSCTSYGSEASGTQNFIPSGTTAGGVEVFCGDTELATATSKTGKNGKVTTTITCDTTVTLPAGTEIVVVNGILDTCGTTTTLDGDAGATLIFTGNSTGPSSTGFFTNSGTVEVDAPSSGTFENLAIYQDPNYYTLAKAPTITFAGNSPVIEVNGIIYTPNAAITISGTITSNGACVGFLAQTITINGTGNVINSNSSCGVDLSGSQFQGARVTLVQ